MLAELAEVGLDALDSSLNLELCMRYRFYGDVSHRALLLYILELPAMMLTHPHVKMNPGPMSIAIDPACDCQSILRAYDAD